MRKLWLMVMLLSCLPRMATASYAPETDVPRRPPAAVRDHSREWMKTMEASLTHLSGDTEASSGGVRDVVTWLGWALALICFLSLLGMQFKLRRQNRFMLRAGQRDHFLMPPAGNRRSGPR